MSLCIRYFLTNYQCIAHAAEIFRRGRQLRGLCNIRYPSETHMKPKSREVSFSRSVLLSYSIVSKFCHAFCKISNRMDNWNDCYGRGLRLKRVWGGYAILHSPQGSVYHAEPSHGISVHSAHLVLLEYSWSEGLTHWNLNELSNTMQ